MLVGRAFMLSETHIQLGVGTMLSSYKHGSLRLHFTSLREEHLSPAETFFSYVPVQRL